MAHTSFFCASSFVVLHLHFTFYTLTLSPCSWRIPQKQYLKTPHSSTGSCLYWWTHGVFNHLDSERLSQGMRYIIGWRLWMGLWLLVRTLALWLWLLPTTELTLACFWTFFLFLTMEPVLYSAPPIPAGIRSFQWNSGGIHRNPQEFQWNPAAIQSFQWNSTGIRMESSRLRLKYSFIEVTFSSCADIYTCLSLPFWHHVYSSTYP